MKKIHLVFVIIGLFFGGMTGKGMGEVIRKELLTVDKVDLNRYVGLWYEIAKIPNRFQKKCRGNTTAVYRFRKDGRITVVNSCRNRKGKTTVAKGIAKVVDRVSNSKLKVSFVNLLGIRLFWGKYWIIGLDPEYQYAIVGEPNRKYGWILGRTPKLSESQWAEINQILKDRGYDKKRFVRTQHFE